MAEEGRSPRWKKEEDPGRVNVVADMGRETLDDPAPRRCPEPGLVVAEPGLVVAEVGRLPRSIASANPKMASLVSAVPGTVDAAELGLELEERCFSTRYDPQRRSALDGVADPGRDSDARTVEANDAAARRTLSLSCTSSDKSSKLSPSTPAVVAHTGWSKSHAARSWMHRVHRQLP
jgi:hypothetical protein